MDRRKGLTVRSGSGIGIDFMFRGQRRRETLRLAPTKQNLLYAARKRETILYEIAQGTFNFAKHFPNSPNARALSGRSSQTVGQALDEFMMAARQRCAYSTLRDYQSALDHHLKPTFGDRLITELSVSEIKAWIAGLDITPKRINNVLVPLRSVLKDAFLDQVIDRNPAALPCAQ